MFETAGQRRIFWLLVGGGALVRLALAAALGLGIDESYMVSAGRSLQLGYFDHPPVSWWLSSGMAHLAGSEAAGVVRLPFIALFAVSTALMWRLTSLLVSVPAAPWAALCFNLAPVFGITSGGWVLPDGPLVCALLGMALCLAHALQGRGAGWWLGAGLLGGLALLSKYSGGLVLAGAGIYLLTQPVHRRWLARPGPWLALAVCVLAFAPVILWNAGHGWASFAFQGSRATAARLNPAGPLLALGGQSLFLLPWVWLGLMVAAWGALRQGPRVWQDWLLLCLAAGPVLLFTLVAAWSRNVLFHWAAPGYLFLFPLLGGRLAEWQGQAWLRRMTVGTLVLLAAGLLAVTAEVRFGLLGLPGDPAWQAVDWTMLRPALAQRGLLDRPLAAPSWADTGKLDHALGGAPAVSCFNIDCRQYRTGGPLPPPPGADVLIIAPRQSAERIAQDYARHFDRIEILPPLQLVQPHRPPHGFALVLGHGLRGWPYPPARVDN